MCEKDQKNQKLLYLIIGAVGLLVLLRVLLVFRFALFAILLLGGVGYGVYRLFKWLEERSKQKSMAQKPEGIMAAKIAHCNEQIGSINQEVKEIKENIQQLEQKLRAATNISEATRTETREVIREFRSELKLRKAKLDFFITCKRKLEGLQSNYLLNSELKAKKEKLKKLKENNFEDLASMEELKSDVEMDILYLDTIEDLSQRLLASTTFDDADHLRLELEEMTRDLDEFYDDTV